MMSYGDTEFGGNWNLKGNVSVQEVRVVQSVQGALVNGLDQSEIKPLIEQFTIKAKWCGDGCHISGVFIKHRHKTRV